MPDTSSLESIQDLYFKLDQNFNTLYAACQTPDQQNQLRRDYVNARDAFWEARNRAFLDQGPVVASVVNDLQNAKQSLDSDLKNLKDVVQTLKTIDTAVSFASRLIAVGAAAL